MFDLLRYSVHTNLINAGDGYHINVLESYWPIHVFRATLGHKANHSFTKTNVQFGFVYHPRFGYIRSLVTKRDIKKDEELFVNYNYGFNNAHMLPKWYIETYEKEVGPFPKPKQGQRQSKGKCSS